MEGIMFVCMDVGVAAAYVVFVMEGIMFVCMDVGVAAAYVVFVMVGIMFVCMDVGVAAACVGFVMVCMMFECMDVGCSTMPGFTNINDISSTSWMVRTPGNSVGVAFSRRRYPQQDNCKHWVGGNHKIENNAYG